MKKIALAILAFIIWSSTAGLGTVTGKEVELTVYTDNLALVKDVRWINLKRGRNEVKFTDVASKIDPTSVRFKSLTAPDGVSIWEQRYEYDLVSFNAILQKYLGEQIRVFTADGPYKGTLLSSSGEGIVLSDPEGRIRIIRNQTIRSLEFPSMPKGMVTLPTLTWVLENKRDGRHEVEVSYLTAGIGWHAEYIAVVTEDEVELEFCGLASIDNKSGITYKDAKLKLVAGELHRAEKLPSIRHKREEMGLAVAPRFEEEPLFEYHVYALKERTTVENNQIKQMQLFPTTRVEAKKIFTYDGLRNRNRVHVELEFKNSRDKGLGMPLPRGRVRVYKRGKDKSLEFVGEDRIGHTPQDGEVRTYLGNAFDIAGQRVVKERKRIGDRIRDEVVEIKLSNHRDEDVEVVVVEHLRGDWEILESSRDFRRKDVHTIEFDLPVEKGREAKVEYKVRYRW